MVFLLALANTGCAQLGVFAVRMLIELPLRMALHSVDLRPGYSTPVPQTNFSECELARGRWREHHQDAGDYIPPEYQCLPNGDWPPEAETAVIADAKKHEAPAATAPTATQDWGLPPPPAPTAAPTSTETFRVYDYNNPGAEVRPGK